MTNKLTLGKVAERPPLPHSLGEKIERDTGRPERIPLGQRQLQLNVTERKGIHRHWFNDADMRIEQAKLAGYKLVTDDTDQIIKKKVGTNADGGAMYAYLMEAPESYRQEDEAARVRDYNNFVASVNKGAINTPEGQSSDPNAGFYAHQDLHKGIQYQS